MTIEFNCPSCSKVLKTADDKAGLSAKCPGCGQVLVVPASKSEAFESEPARESKAKDGWDDWNESEGQATDKDEFAPPQRKKRPCPMCGQEIMAAARLCRHCGERFDDGKSVPAGSGKFAPTTIEAGEVLSVAWGTFKENIGMAIVGMIIPAVITFVVQMIVSTVIFAVMFAMIQQGMKPDDFQMASIQAASNGSDVLLRWLMGTYFGLGQAIFFLKMCRGEEATVGDLFGAGKFYLRGLVVMLLVGLMVMVGLLAVCIGAIIVGLVMSPVLYYLADRDEGVMETINGTYKLAWPNLGSIFVLALANFGIAVAGTLALCVGLIPAIPLTMVINATAYLMMSGQLNSRTPDVA